MKAIVISEERFKELCDAFLLTMKEKSLEAQIHKATTDDDAGSLSFRLVNYYFCNFKDAVGKALLP